MTPHISVHLGVFFILFITIHQLTTYPFKYLLQKCVISVTVLTTLVSLTRLSESHTLRKGVARETNYELV